MEIKWTEYNDRTIGFKVDYHSIKVAITDGDEVVKFTISGRELVAGVNALATALPSER